MILNYIYFWVFYRIICYIQLFFETSEYLFSHFLQHMPVQNLINEYVPISSHNFKLQSLDDPAGPRINHQSHLLLILSSYMWLKDHSKLDDVFTCRASDFRVSSKLASSAFAPKLE